MRNGGFVTCGGSQGVRMCRLACAILLLGAIAGPGILAGQGVDRTPVGVWMSGSLGVAVPHSIGVYGTAAVRYRRLVVRGRYALSDEFLGDSKEDWGALVGVVVTPPTFRGQVVVGAGLGVVRGSRGCVLCGSAPDDAVVGALMDVELRYPFASFIGISAYFYADANADQSFGGLTLGLFVGRL